jgi:hypothetical protein
MRLRHLIASSSAIAALSLEEVAHRIGKPNLIAAATASRSCAVSTGLMIVLDTLVELLPRSAVVPRRWQGP